MTDPERERLIAELERICLGDDLTERDFAAVQAAIEQLRADHPAQVEAAVEPQQTPAQTEATATEQGGGGATAAASEPDETALGSLTWHSSGEDEGPDVGIAVGLGEGKSLYIGEISRDLHEEGGADAVALGDDGGWWMVIWPERFPLARFVDGAAARSCADAVFAAIQRAHGGNQPQSAATLSAVPGLVEALQPFADLADAIDAGHEPRMLRADDSPIWSANVFQVGPLDITMRKLRAARAVIRALAGDTKGK